MDASDHLGLFVEEGRTALGALAVHLRALRPDPSDPDALAAAFRLAHSLKGMSAAMGLEGFTRSVAPFLAPGASVRDAVRDHLAARLLVARDWKPRRPGPARPDEVHLVLPAATPSADVVDVQRRFRIAGVSRVTLTKLDETRHLGTLVNLPLRVGRPRGYLADEPAVPDAIAPADARRVAETLLP